MVKRIEGETALARFGALRVFPDTGAPNKRRFPFMDSRVMVLSQFEPTTRLFPES
jgi:hypothetical protein